MPAPGRMGPWQLATVVAVRRETSHARTFTLRLPRPEPHRPGQHYVLRLTAPDGYRAQRSYSIASAPGGDTVELTVERLEGGEVSEFLHDVVQVGDELEVRGPIGGFFQWDGRTPALAVGGGSGVVPLMAMLRTARRDGPAGGVHLVVSARSVDELYFADEMTGPDVTVAFTRRAPEGSGRPVGRLTPDDLAPHVGAAQVAFVCGSPAFCQAAGDLLLGLGVAAPAIRVERFGPSG